MKKILIALLVFIVIAGVLVISCPNKTLHVSVLKQELMENTTKTPKDKWEALGNAIASSVAETMIENYLSVKNYFVFSLGKLNGKTVSVGLLGHVFTGDISKHLSEKKEDPKVAEEEPQKPMGAEFYYADGSRIENYEIIRGASRPGLFVDAIRREISAKAPKKEDYTFVHDYDCAIARWNNDPIYGWLEKNSGVDGEKYSIEPFTGNLRVYTTINPRMQAHAEEAVTEQLVEIQTAFDRECATRNNNPYVSETHESLIKNDMRFYRRWSDRSRIMKVRGCSQEEIDASFNQPTKMRIFSWKKRAVIDTVMTPNDSILYYKSLARTALIAMNPNTGAVQAYVGNEYGQLYDFASQGKLQIGSAIQPFFYSWAMETGMTPCATVANEPQTFSVGEGTWTPRSANPESAVGSIVSLKWGLSHSSTNISALLVKEATVPVEMANLKKFHIPLQDEVASIAVGVDCTSPIDLTAAYNVFANKGRYVQPALVSKITDLEGNVLYENKPLSEFIITEESAYYMTNMLQSVVDVGTGMTIRSKYKLEGDAAGKTGTTTDNSGSWFIGYVPNLTVGVWTGWESRYIHFMNSSLGQSSATSLPIWAKFVKKCQEDTRLKISKTDKFSIPSGVSPVTCTGDDEDIL